VNSVPSPNLRISDLDREAALTALGEHMSVGRIDLDEYGERSAKVTAVKTRGELAEIFEDLPQPHPKLGEDAVEPVAAKAVEPKPAPKPGEPIAWADRPLAQRLTAALVPLSFVAAVLLFFLTGHNWLWILLPMGLAAVGRGLWGQEWDKDRQRHHHPHHHDWDRRERHLDRLERHRDRDERRDRRRGITD